VANHSNNAATLPFSPSEDARRGRARIMAGLFSPLLRPPGLRPGAPFQAPVRSQAPPSTGSTTPAMKVAFIGGPKVRHLGQVLSRPIPSQSYLGVAPPAMSARGLPTRVRADRPP
jgi:hypothetical protein